MNGHPVGLNLTFSPSNGSHFVDNLNGIWIIAAGFQHERHLMEEEKINHDIFLS